VDIRSETEFAAEEAEHGYEEEEVQGRCAAVLSNGRRCPNASLQGSRYCGLETHQALASIATDNVADLNAPGGEPAEGEAADEGDEDVAALAHDGETDAGPEAPSADAEAAENPAAGQPAGVAAESSTEAPAEQPTDMPAATPVQTSAVTPAETPAEEPAP
jgi:N utilization substance protein A